jgi:hypothetical protein
VVRDAVAAMPLLVDELEHGGAAPVDVNAIAGRADAISGREAAAVPPPAPMPAPVEAPAAPEAVEVEEAGAIEVHETGSMDPVLHDIFRKETAGSTTSKRTPGISSTTAA